MRRSAALGLVLGWLLAAPAHGAEVLWQGAASAQCQIALSFADGPVEIVLGGVAPRLLGDPLQTKVSAGEAGGQTALALTGSAGVVLHAPLGCRLDVDTQTGDITLWVANDGDLRVELATSGEITVDFSVAIDYHHHEEPAKRGLITIGSGTAETRLWSRRGAIRVLRPRR